MHKLNSNNSLIWTGSFNDRVAIVIANDDTVTVNYGTEFIVINVFSNDFATFGIDTTYIEVTVQGYPDRPAVFDPVAGTLTLFVPPSMTPADTVVWKYKIVDLLGNRSNDGTITMDMNARQMAWRGYAASYSCILDGGGVNTGYARYGFLEQYYVDNNLAVDPLTLKSNAPWDPDYIADEYNPTTCPLPSTDSGVYVWHQYPNVIVRHMSFYRAGTGIVEYDFGMLFTPESHQPLQLQILPGTYDIVFNVDTRNQSNAGHIEAIPGGVGGGSVVHVDVTALEPPTLYTLYNVTFGSPFGGDIFIY